MSVVRTPCQRILQNLTPKPSRWPLFSALHGEHVEFTPGHLWAATQERIDFRERMRRLEESGPYLYVDLGPSGSLATAVKYNLPGTSTSGFTSVITQFGQECRSLERMISTQEQFLSR
jgi:acyl transferase domain-containing protein